MKEVKILKDHLDFKKGKTVEVTDRTAEKFIKDGIAADPQKKEEKKAFETKEEKKAPVKKVTKSPK